MFFWLERIRKKIPNSFFIILHPGFVILTYVISGLFLYAYLVKYIILVVFLFALALGAFALLQNQQQQESVGVENQKIAPLFEALDTPWEVRFLSDGRTLVTQRPGVLTVFEVDGKTINIEIADVAETSEGGLLGLALHPEFDTNKLIYVYKTTRNAGLLENMVERYRFDGDKLSEGRIIIDGIPAATNHNGGRLAFGPDKMLYITTGDAAEDDLAQDRSSLAGKILRLTAEGSVPVDNPFGNAVYSYGHRNPEGIAWDDNGRLWATEHGSSAFDELNRVEKGKNYGWPVIRGDQGRDGMEKPVLHSGNDTWAPADIAFFGGRLYFAGLRGESVFVANPDSVNQIESRLLRGEYGRIRAVEVGPKNVLYFGTSNRDGRGQPTVDDDRILPLDSV